MKRLLFPITVPALLLLSLGCGDASKESRAGGSSADSATTEAPAAPDTSASAFHIPALELSYEERQGRRLFLSHCAVCHGTEGKGDGFNAFNLDPRPRDLTDTDYMRAISDQALGEVISQGGRGMNRSVLMPAYGGSLTEHEIDNLVAFVRHMSTSQERSDQ